MLLLSFRVKYSPVAVTETGLGIMLSFERSDGLFGLHDIGIATIITIINVGISRFFFIF
jgi:hypothetical protein